MGTQVGECVNRGPRGVGPFFDLMRNCGEFNVIQQCHEDPHDEVRRRSHFGHGHAGLEHRRHAKLT